MTLIRRNEHKWLGDVSYSCLQQSLIDLNKAFTNFFNKRSKFPTFKRKHSHQSYRVPLGKTYPVSRGELKLPKIKGGVRIKVNREIDGQPKSITISKTPSGKYFASVLCKVSVLHKCKTGESIGIDLGIKDFITLSDG